MEPTGVALNYAIHGTVLDMVYLKIVVMPRELISEYAEQKIGAPVLFINGAAGNLAPIYITLPNAGGSGRLGTIPGAIGDKILLKRTEGFYPRP